VLVAGDAATAEQLAGATTRLDLLVTDLMPNGGPVTGVELTRRLRRSHPELRVIFLCDLPGQHPEPAEGGVLARPVTPDRLARTAQATLRRRAGAPA
jgi:DNA-binding response OmpR family regulator